jgi:cytochrome c biogenesis protein ResB
MKILFIVILLSLTACSSTPLTKEEIAAREQNHRNLRQFHHNQN